MTEQQSLEDDEVQDDPTPPSEDDVKEGVEDPGVPDQPDEVTVETHTSITTTTSENDDDTEKEN